MYELPYTIILQNMISKPDFYAKIIVKYAHIYMNKNSIIRKKIIYCVLKNLNILKELYYIIYICYCECPQLVNVNIHLMNC